ncbi:Imm53 family immunity protein [Streptomyces sp. NPDC015232]|uniref:Imm53 family immunity protein n=1 Tax=unclassified Streptomyces TaxID=2593676 RepID=UPI0036F8D30A
MQHWYASQCDGEWEHEWGGTIGTLDDWLMAWTPDRTFHLACGPGHLTEALELFRAWVSGDAA